MSTGSSPHRASLLPDGRRRRVLLGVLLVLVPLWQWTLYEQRVDLDRSYHDGSATGLCIVEWSRFFYYFYYFDAFPMLLRIRPESVRQDRLHKNFHYRRDYAEWLLRERGSDLVMADDLPCAVGQVGDYGKLLLLLPAAWWRGSPIEPTLQPVAIALFVLSLIALLLAAYRERCLALGVLLVLLVGSHPFQLFETYVRPNVFSLVVPSALLVLALNLKFLRTRPRPTWGDWLRGATTAMFLATAYEVRTEAAVTLLSVLGAYLAAGMPWRRRAALAALVLAGFFLTGLGWDAYFDRKFDRAKRLVLEHGGEPFPGPRVAHHPVWHSIFCGLGDFAEDRGYVWMDRRAFEYATPLLNSEYGMDLSYSGGFYYDNTYDASGVYHIKPESLPEYSEVLRTKVLGDILQSPAWYAGVIAKRIQRVFQETTPVRVHWIGGTLEIPFHGCLVLPLLVWALWRRECFLVKLLLFTAPMSLVPVFVYSGQGTTYYAIYPHVTAAIFAVLAYEGLSKSVARRLGTRRPPFTLP